MATRETPPLDGGNEMRHTLTREVQRDQLIGGEKKPAEGARGYPRDHPLASLGVAVAAGYALSRRLSIL